MFDGLYFEYPKVFSFIIVYIACEAYCKIRSQAIYFPHVKRLTKETTQLSTLMWFLKWFGIVFLVLALMSPVRDEQLVLEPEYGPDVVFVLYVNKAMQEVGFNTDNAYETRYEGIKKWINRWLEKDPYSHYGLVVATDECYIASPLSMSTKALQVVVDQLPVNYYSGEVDHRSIFQQALTVLEHSSAKRKIIVFIGDSSDIQAQWDVKNHHDVKRYSIALVSADKLTASEEAVEQASDEHYVVSTLDELNSVYQAINKKEKLTVPTYDYTFKAYYYFYPLFLAFFSLLLYVYLRNRRGDI